MTWTCLPEWARVYVPCYEEEADRTFRKRSAEIDKVIRKEKSRLRKQVRILLLGTGESGKTTFLKQMRIVHADGFTTTEKFNFRSVIYMNIILSMKVLADALSSFSIPLGNEANRHHMEEIKNWNRQEMTPATFSDYQESLVELWEDCGIQTVFSMRAQFQLGESIRYYMSEDNLSRIKQLDYLPSSADILWARRRTDLVTETEVSVKRVPFSFIDVGGQRTQRQKWFQYFHGSINSVLFFVAISEFDQTLVEDKSSNRIIESLKVFKYVISQKAFRDRDIILFFNKNDLLEEKINNGIKVTDFFPNMGFMGDPLKLEDVQNFFRDLFYTTAQVRLELPLDNGQLREDLGMYHHFTVAIDTDNIKRVFDAVKDMVLKENMTQLMLE